MSKTFLGSIIYIYIQRFVRSTLNVHFFYHPVPVFYSFSLLFTLSNLDYKSLVMLPISSPDKGRGLLWQTRNLPDAKFKNTQGLNSNPNRQTQRQPTRQRSSTKQVMSRSADPDEISYVDHILFTPLKKFYVCFKIKDHIFNNITIYVPNINKSEKTKR